MFETQPPLTAINAGAKYKKGRTITEGFKGHRSKSLNNMAKKMQFRKKIRHAPISLHQL